MHTRNFLTVCLKLGFSLALVAALLMASDVSTVVAAIRASDHRYFISAVTLSFAAMFLAALRWRILVGRFNSEVAYAELFYVIGLSYFYNFFVPGGIAGDLIRALECREHRLSSAQGMASVVVDRVIGLGSFLLVGLTGSIFAIDLQRAGSAGSWLWVLFASLIVGIPACLNRRLMGHLRVLAAMSPSAYEKLKHCYDSICAYRDHGREAACALAVSVFTALANIGSFYLLSRAAGSDVGWGYFLVYVPVITVVSYVPVTFSGLGIRELCFVTLFTNAGMTAGQALAVPIMYFGMLLILSLAGGVLFLAARGTRAIMHRFSE